MRQRPTSAGPRPRARARCPGRLASGSSMPSRRLATRTDTGPGSRRDRGEGSGGQAPPGARPGAGRGAGLTPAVRGPPGSTRRLAGSLLDQLGHLDLLDLLAQLVGGRAAEVLELVVQRLVVLGLVVG